MGDKGLKFPVIGKFRRKLILSSFFQAMAQSLSSGMNVINSLDLSLKAVGSKDCRQILSAASVSVTEGTALSDAFKASGLFDETVLSLVSAGEQSSSLGNVFSQLADMYEEEIESGLKTFSSLVEPVSTLATGVVVGIIIFAMFMPIIKLISVLGG
jgi:type IV pilus assembly protein PilC